ncbi:ATP-binding protein [uncultured Enterococcus sp.]|uniref:ATP-binding protein n=1 Tax=uncultured Enterococcus sp. TaxID=167972 RepID=UPI002AA7F384|nr:ATP-binding protein [uncultured Enterococcus sp.]
MKKNIVTLLPNAASLIESMRSIGYSFEMAIADVIDNSISAEAKKIDIFLLKREEEPFIQIIDNGFGMDNSELLEAMRLGSKNPSLDRQENDLGRFGLGLKSASFSQCKVLTVISKKMGIICGYQWDLNRVSITDRFEVIKLTDDQIRCTKNIEYLDNNLSGTIVQWEDFDRIIQSSKSLQNELTNLMNQAVDHLSLIYHRYLRSGTRILVNNTKIESKDPFLVDHPSTQIRPSKTILVDGVKIRLQPYVIPYFSKLSAEDKRNLGKSNDQYFSQGFYLYRNRRLIVWGDYLGLARKSELAKNLRIQVDIPNSLDYMWEIDVKKSRASVPSKIKKNLLSSITDGEIVSKKMYSFRGNKEISDEQALWQFIEERDGDFRFEINLENNICQELFSTMDSSQKKLFNILLKALGANLPTKKIYAEMADGHFQAPLETSEIIEDLNEILSHAELHPKINSKKLVKSLICTEPFNSNKKAIEILNAYILRRD